ncbi:TIR domain-containing protein [Flavobacterium psychrophilum]|uniref:TIR domain-containing protein n=2 Tax=Flavobacterium psychrophilum TaxID=96345 RepID=UPI0009033CF9|nr:TIR domain-containing protein [Flavobacterium psychrophilum]EKT4499320.1 TIR domain-containing protein [Flavobacterium psychrophilum]OJH11707.1 hypothetical protein FPG87_08530 [Flavobacterium psychrophilum]SNA77407.1 hypothetical protein DK150_400072 [Flavobacterium psychrophilum]SNA86395.1 hypothetical protein FI146_580046 [Flavobacterium psychrophilum]
MHNKIFISYAKEDIIFAEKLYSYLELNDFRPWLDKKDLLPGQNWNFTIKKSLREADYIIALLSSNSVQKRGYVQREFKLALDYYEEKLEDDIYLIPLKINNCEIPLALSKFQWTDFNENDSFQKILQSLNLQREKLIDYERKQIAAKELFAYEEKIEKFSYFKNISFDFDINYIQFLDYENTNLKEINEIILGTKTNDVLSSRSYFFEENGEIIDTSSEIMGWYFEFSIVPNLISRNIVSLNESHSNFTGGAHGSYYLIGHNFRLNPVLKIQLKDLFDYDEHESVLLLLSNFCFEKLREVYNEWTETTEEDMKEQNRNNLFWENCLDPEWKNFDNYFISKNSLEIIFNPYSVSGWAFGLQIVSIEYDYLIENIKNSEKIKTLKSELQ